LILTQAAIAVAEGWIQKGGKAQKNEAGRKRKWKDSLWKGREAPLARKSRA